jgi:hypothetical protein
VDVDDVVDVGEGGGARGHRPGRERGAGSGRARRPSMTPAGWTG